MRHSFRSLLLLVALLGAAPAALRAQDAPATPPRPDRTPPHVFTIPNFRTESGTTLPLARVVYGTYGHLNAAHDNAILLPSHYMADRHGYEWLMGPGKALDTTKVFLVTSELFGNGHSSSPSNTPEPFHGPRFPVMTIRDNVAAVHQLLVNDLKINHLRAIIGFSMGAQQAFQWAVSYPTFADRLVATSGTAKTYPHGIVRLEGQIAALTADAAFQNGDYTAPPTKGIEAFSVVWTAWLYSQEWWRLELWKADNKPGTTFEQVLHEYRTHFIPGADANDLILQMRTWESNNVGATTGFGGNVEKALRSIKAPILYMPSATDLYFPLTDARYEAAFIPGVVLKPIPSLWGHTAGAAPNPADAKFLNDNIKQFLAQPRR
ncbi:alpha/beta fold hydrolase [Hymenobacter siberiensis]|uniref:alpha/beta fold hydrolase n=1 Tax=Hymenobacter siberiensis TaxID=2848396 RepID=UPI001C1DDEE5|nr:alpha/beta fold hydrolase [Hymenobacter siberiensis]MBU6119469.1 alpha/beta fold hydrolase [Hymenobacter siberiensis]